MKSSASNNDVTRNRMVLTPAAILYTILDAEHFESLDRYQASPELRCIVEGICTPDWQIQADGFWTRCSPLQYKFNAQGWKIHISATERTATRILQLVVPVLKEEEVAFKFASDLRMVRFSTSKNWPRSGGGKFITVYPKDLNQFLRLLDLCHNATKGFAGPYILSDRPYLDSKVVFYRYGGHKIISSVTARGLHVPMILSPQGDLVPDERVAFYKKPEWIQEPFNDQAASGSDTSLSRRDTLKLNGRYHVTGALKYSNTGGVYTGTDLQTGERVIIREARPFVTFGGNDGTEAIALLKKEARVLKKLEASTLTPRFIDLFQQWEHWFLVEEYIQAETLWGYIMNAIFGWSSHEAPKLFAFYRETIVALTKGLQLIHNHQIIVRDLTKTNVMFTADGQAKFIDFELAYEIGGDELPVAGSTEGYASPEQLAHQTPTPEQDYYALGALILESLTFTAGGLRLNRDGIFSGLKQVLDDFSLPAGLLDIVRGLTDLDPTRRWTPYQVLEIIERMEVPAGAVTALPSTVVSPPSRPNPSETLKRELEITLRQVTTYLESKVEYHRHDRLWPSSCEVFLLNPVNFEFGATGIAAYLHQRRGSIPVEIVDWITARSTPDRCPTGLFVGLSGVAVFLLQIGEIEKAKKVLQSSVNRNLIFELPGLYEGAAGWGLANLHFWKVTREESYLANAIEVGERLLATAKSDLNGTYWEDQGRIPLGLAWGGAGIALFLLYLNAARNCSRFIEAAERALDYEMSQARQISDSIYFTDTSDAPRSAPKSPHTRYGTAGVGAVAIRLYSATKKAKFRQIADLCAHTVSSRYTNKIWQDYGLAGFGEFMLDMFHFLRDQNYLNNAFHIAEGILPFRIQRPEGTAFAGTEMVRICCDWGNGTAGIASFLQRLLNPENPRPMFLDCLL